MISFSISHLSGFPSAAKKLGAFAGGGTACTADDMPGVKVPVADPADEVEVLMHGISAETPIPNKLKIRLFWRMIDPFDLNDEPMSRKIHVRNVKFRVD